MHYHLLNPRNNWLYCHVGLCVFVFLTHFSIFLAKAVFFVSLCLAIIILVVVLAIMCACGLLKTIAKGIEANIDGGTPVRGERFTGPGLMQNNCASTSSYQAGKHYYYYKAINSTSINFNELVFPTSTKTLVDEIYSFCDGSTCFAFTDVAGSFTSGFVSAMPAFVDVVACLAADVIQLCRCCCCCCCCCCRCYCSCRWSSSNA
jgi:hypothetical protein